VIVALVSVRFVDCTVRITIGSKGRANADPVALSSIASTAAIDETSDLARIDYRPIPTW
jgi:hypothetical protein